RWTSCARGPNTRAGLRRSSCGSRASTRRGISSKCSMPSHRLQSMTPAAGLRAAGPLPNPELLHLLMPKVLTARARSVSDKKGRGVRIALLTVIGSFFWVFIFWLMAKLLMYFRNIPEIGLLLSGKLLGLMLVSFFSILLLSNVITALSSFFLAKDLDLLVSGPVDWLR